MKVIYNDGGRKAAGYKGKSGDCVTRAVAIASGLPYETVYQRLSLGEATKRITKRSRRKTSARDGVATKRKWFTDYIQSLGFEWVPTMFIGQGCKVHLRDGELPMGTLIVNVSRHLVAVIDGVIHDTHDCSRRGNRCVYGYWKKTR